jgi:DNA helicase-2/ATP-dependent DNA helicase PcrA
MNWRVSSLDALALISNSDLHSPANLGRNANVFLGEPDFFAIRDGLRHRDPARCGGTVDMFPEEGKYHADGHRKCGVCLEPEQSLKQNNLCNICGQPLVLGVLHRVVELADRPAGFKPPGALPCEHIIPLPELLGEILECGSGSGKVAATYERLLARHGPEMRLLRELDPEALRDESPALLAEAIRRVRREQVIRRPGYDGEYGEIRVFEEGEKDKLLQQGVFLNMPVPVASRRKPTPRGKRETGAEARDHSMVVAEAEAAPAYGTPAAAASVRPGVIRSEPGPDWLADLTSAQRQAVQSGPEPLLIVAGPGTGKTRTLTARFAWLIRQGANPERMLAVTFTNRAARELRDRLSRLLPDRKPAAGPAVATFHGFALDVLRRHAAEAGFPPDFRLLGQEDEQALLQRVTGLSARVSARVLAELAGRRQRLEPVSDLPGMAAHEAALRQGRWLPLDEIVPGAVGLLRDRPELVTDLGLDWIGVDEYQDINQAQYELIRLLAPNGRGLTVIGDPDQAIYGVRGSDVRYFLQFTRDFPGAITVGLDTNFRSSGAIVKASAQVMAPGRSALSASVRSAAGPGVQVRLHEAATAAAEAEFIAHEIEQWLGGTAQFSMDSGRVGRAAESDGVSLGDVAVLVRLRALMPPLAEALARLGLPVQSVSDQPLLEQPGGHDLLAALQTRLETHSDESAHQALEQIGQNFALEADARARLEECRLLLAEPGQPLQAFLDDLLLRQGADAYEDRAEKIALLTLHAAKGLEFPVVFVAGCEDGLIPYVREACEPDLAEERRLFYVAMTRARRVLYLTRARRRLLFGRTWNQAPSPFLDDIQDVLQRQVNTAPRRKRAGQGQIEFDFS